MQIPTTITVCLPFILYIFFELWEFKFGWLVVNDQTATGDEYIYNFQLKLEKWTAQAVLLKVNYTYYYWQKNGK